MKLTLTDSKLLKDSISVISDLISEAQFKISKDGMELIAMDPANVAMVIFKLYSNVFENIELDGDEAIIRINIGNLKQVLKRAKPNEKISLELKDDQLKVELSGKAKKEYSLPLIDMQETEQRIPNLEPIVSITTKSSILNEAIEDVEIIAESVGFAADKNKFRIFAKSDLSTGNITILQDDDTKIETGANSEVGAKYSIEYLKRMIAGSKLSSIVTIKFNDDYPLKLEYSSPDKVDLAFILAPRVDK